MAGDTQLTDTDPRITAAADWLRSDDTAYEQSPDTALRAAREMLRAADAVDPVRVRRSVAAENKRTTCYCSFCGKSQHEVRKLIAGPTVFICDECIELCLDIITAVPKTSVIQP